MAEIFGIIAGVAGFPPLVKQLCQITQSLRRIHAEAEEAPATLAYLANRVELLGYLIERIDILPSSCSNDSIIVEQALQSECQDAILKLQQLEQRLRQKLKTNSQTKRPKIITFRNWGAESKNLEKSIADAERILILTMSFITCRTSLPTHQTQTSSLEGQQLKSLDQKPTPLLEADSTSSIQIRTGPRDFTESFKPPRRWNCETRRCSCSCHITERVGSRYWLFEYTPLTSSRICDNELCSGAEYHVGVRFTLSQLGIRWLAAFHLRVTAGAGSLSLRPSLTMERVVPYTSPGFEILQLTLHRALKFEEAREKLLALSRSDPTFKDHVDPSGHSYLEVLVRDGRLGQTEDVYHFLQLFMKELKITKGSENLRFLLECVRWGKEATRLLECIVECGYDTTAISSPNVGDWPLRQFSNWTSGDNGFHGYYVSNTPDPFFVDYLGLLCRNNQGWGMMSPLHEAVLSPDIGLVAKWISRSKKDERNFLGQSPVHLAASNPHHLESLIQAGHDVDAVDHYGATPLVYAATMNQEKNVMLLIDAGASLGTFGARSLDQRIFVHCAAHAGNWNLMMPILNKVNSKLGGASSENLAEAMAYLSFVMYPNRPRERHYFLQQILSNCGSVNFTFDCKDGKRTLLFYAKSVGEVELLLENGFSKVNHEDSYGQTAIFAAVYRPSTTGLIEKLVDLGLNVNHKDKSRRTALFYVLECATFYSDRDSWGAMDVARVLLANGAEYLYRDDCRCSCEPGGCLSTVPCQRYLYLNSECEVSPFWSLEWLSILLEHGGETAAKSALLGFIRKFKHQEMDMTHVCRRSRWGLFHEGPAMADEDIDEILEEESEFIDILEGEMSQYSGKTFQDLLHDCMLILKTYFGELRRAVSKYGKKPARNFYFEECTLTADHKRDIYVKGYNQMEEGPVSDAILHVAAYVCWLERGHHSSTEPANEATRENWRRTMFYWLHELIDALAISVEDIVEDMRWLSESDEDSGRGSVGLETHISCFVSSLREYSSSGGISEELSFSN